MEAKKSWKIAEDGVGERVDKHVAAHTNMSRQSVQTLIKEGNILVNNKQVKNNYVLARDDEISIAIQERTSFSLKPEPMSLDVRYEDEHLLIVNKPRGLVVHPAPGHATGTLLHGLLAYTSLSDVYGEERQGIVHRIDKDTSGLLLIAKHNDVHERLAEQLKYRNIERKYKAIVHGSILHEKGTIDAPIGRDPKNRKRMAVTDHHGKEAVTYFQVLERFQDYTFVECELVTGRTHQIRVHMAYIGHPVAGDPLYGRKKTLPIDGQALHAFSLTFVHPMTDETIAIEAPLPDDMVKELEKLKNTP